MEDHNLPKEPGLYFATDFPLKANWELIVNVYGETPFLKCDMWNYLPPKINPVSCLYPNQLYYGPKIEMPERDPQAIPLKNTKE